MQITLAPEIENIVTEYAVKQNISPELLVQNVLKEWFGSRIIPEASDRDKTLADHLADHIGVLSSSEYVSGGKNKSGSTGLCGIWQDDRSADEIIRDIYTHRTGFGDREITL